MSTEPFMARNIDTIDMNLEFQTEKQTFITNTVNFETGRIMLDNNVRIHVTLFQSHRYQQIRAQLFFLVFKKSGTIIKN